MLNRQERGLHGASLLKSRSEWSEASLPLELVQCVTGDRAVKVVMRHYFRPGREDFRQTILKAMPRILAERSRPSVEEEMLQVLEGMTVRTTSLAKRKLLEMLDEV